MTSIGALPAAVAMPVSFPAPAVAAVPATTSAQTTLAQIEDAVRIGSVPLDPAAFAAIMGSIDPSGSAGAAHDNAAFQDTMAMIGASDGHSYSLYDLLKQSFAAS